MYLMDFIFILHSKTEKKKKKTAWLDRWDTRSSEKLNNLSKVA